MKNPNKNHICRPQAAKADKPAPKLEPAPKPEDEATLSSSGSRPSTAPDKGNSSNKKRTRFLYEKEERPAGRRWNGQIRKRGGKKQKKKAKKGNKKKNEGASAANTLRNIWARVGSQIKTERNIHDMIHVVHERECFANVPNGFRVWGDTGRASSVKISSATTRKQQLWGSLCVLLCWAMGSQRGGGNRYVEGNPSLSANLCWMMPFQASFPYYQLFNVRRFPRDSLSIKKWYLG